MKRSAMKRAAPPARPPATQCTYSPRPRAVAVASGEARMSVPVPKSAPLRDESYRRWVASLPCMHCGVEGYSQAAHADQGKGMALKASDDTCFPACGPHYVGTWLDGCHYDIGTGGRYTKTERRELEARYAAETRALYARRSA